MAEISGHPTVELPGADGNGVLITVCSSCGQMRTILFLSKDRWICTNCRVAGAAPPAIRPLN